MNLCVFFGLHKHFYVNQDIGRFCRSSVIIISFVHLYNSASTSTEHVPLCIGEEQDDTIRDVILTCARKPT